MTKGYKIMHATLYIYEIYKSYITVQGRSANTLIYL